MNGDMFLVGEWGLGTAVIAVVLLNDGNGQRRL